jgi:hypothetical protein
MWTKVLRLERFVLLLTLSPLGSRVVVILMQKLYVIEAALVVNIVV